jgi:hypothetical protein
MNKFYPLYFLFFCIFFTSNAQTDTTGMPKIPVMRQLFHINIAKAQQQVLNIAGNGHVLEFSKTDSDANYTQTVAFNKWVFTSRKNIETDTTLTENDKFIWLRSTENLLKDFITAYQYKSITTQQILPLLQAYQQCVQLQQQQQLIFEAINNQPLAIGAIIVANTAFANNMALQKSKDVLVLKQIQASPKNVLRILNINPTVYFADSVLQVCATQIPEELYNYAASPNAFGKKIRSITTQPTKTISHLANLNVGRQYFPFLDALYKGQLTMDSITNVLNDRDGYYKLLVQTQIQYAGKLNKADTPLVYKTLIERLRFKTIESYIDTINGLHDEKIDAVRFKIIDKLSPTELYYLCVLGDEEIYTSSYLGVYKRIFERMPNPNSDSLLQLVHYNFYKKFIKVAAAYNTLDNFLNRMDVAKADKLMKNFVQNLGNTTTLEDAVDVADSYASITNKKVRNIILEEVATNRYKAVENARTTNIYRILHTIFLSADSTNKIDLTKELGIEPIFVKPNKLLQDTNKHIIVQQFFYGDKDGNNVFNYFVNNFKNANWKIVHKPEWTEVSSTKGNKITIYSNKPLDETLDLDAQAQEHLTSYLDSLQINPTFVIHRGHSYYVKSTINQLATSAKVVLLGSCGGYQSLDKVLHIAPNAHIISSKQTGTGAINQGMITLMMEQLRQGKDLQWPTLWKTLENNFKNTKSKELFDDYVPPHKNLGAIFIMAYDKLNSI